VQIRLDQIVLQYAHEEWRSVTSPGLSIIGLSNLTYKSAGGLQAEMLLHIRPYTNLYLLSCGDILYQFWCCVSDYQAQSVCPHCYLRSVNIDITLGYPAVNITSTKDTLTQYIFQDQKCIIIAHPFFGLHIFANPVHPAVQFLHVPLSMLATSSPSLSSHTQLTLISSFVYPRRPCPQ